MFNKDYINWETIRHFGKLQVLTRASYLALIIVPIVASLWPSVRIAINRYNQAVRQTVEIMERAQEQLDKNIIQLKAVSKKIDKDAALFSIIALNYEKRINDQTKSLSDRVHEFLDEFKPEELDIPNLPTIWVLAYIGALSVMLGHTIYQAAAHDDIKNYSKLEYLENIKRKKLNEGISKNEDISRLIKDAEIRYSNKSHENMTAWYFSAIFYTCGLICILLVIALQSKIVILAAF